LRGTVPILSDGTNLIGGAAMYVGIDYHKRYAVATSMDDKGKVIEQVRLKNEPGDLIGFVDRLPEGSKIAIEATGNCTIFMNYSKARARRFILLIL
jgi:hypothetical protein